MAGHQARSGGTRYIFASPGLASCRRRPLSSNVRPHMEALWRATISNSQITRLLPLKWLQVAIKSDGHQCPYLT